MQDTYKEENTDFRILARLRESGECEGAAQKTADTYKKWAKRQVMLSRRKEITVTPTHAHTHTHMYFV